MEAIKLFDSEWKLMDYIWDHLPCTAAAVALWAERELGWKKNTTYTVMKRLIGKGVLSRSEPDFQISPLVTREQVQIEETQQMVDRLFGGSFQKLFATFIADGALSEREIAELRRQLDEYRK